MLHSEGNNNKERQNLKGAKDPAKGGIQEMLLSILELHSGFSGFKLRWYIQ
jgi:hypothetical protein